MTNRLSAVVGAAGACFFALNVSAATITFNTPVNASTGGGPVDARATFTTSSLFGGSVMITLQDLQANPTDVAQLISDIDFTLSGHQTTGSLDPNITHSFSTLVTVESNGSPTPGPTVFPAWGLVPNFMGGIQLSALAPGATGPAGLLIGPPDAAGNYSNANGSIRENPQHNNPHNPFLDLTATFVVTNIPGVTADTAITTATFSFGTTAGIDIPGIPHLNVPDGGVTVALLGVGLAVLGLLRRKLS